MIPYIKFSHELLSTHYTILIFQCAPPAGGANQLLNSNQSTTLAFDVIGYTGQEKKRKNCQLVRAHQPWLQSIYFLS